MNNKKIIRNLIGINSMKNGGIREKMLQTKNIAISLFLKTNWMQVRSWNRQLRVGNNGAWLTERMAILNINVALNYNRLFFQNNITSLLSFSWQACLFLGQPKLLSGITSFPLWKFRIPTIILSFLVVNCCFTVC